MRGTILVGTEDPGLSVVFEAEPFLFVEVFSMLEEAAERVGVLTGRSAGRAGRLVIQGASEVRLAGVASPPGAAPVGSVRVGCLMPWQRARVVGWFHVRPAMGTHLSTSDIRARARFPRASQFVLYIVDPAANARTLIRWEGGTVVRCSGFLVRGTESELRVAGQLLGPDASIGELHFDLSDDAAPGIASDANGARPRGDARARCPVPRRSRARWGAAARWAWTSVIAFAMLAAWAWSVRVARPRPAPSEAPPPAAEIQADEPVATDVTGAASRPEGELELPESAPSLSAPSASYRIQPGDTLWEISSRYYGAGSQYSVLARSNHIPDPDRIYAGDVLKIPLDLPPIDR